MLIQAFQRVIIYFNVRLIADFVQVTNILCTNLQILIYLNLYVSISFPFQRNEDSIVLRFESSF